jgi:hypothetical protein
VSDHTGRNPCVQILAPITDHPTDPDEKRPATTNPPRFQRASAQAEMGGGLILSE